jgi:hypothetical protein
MILIGSIASLSADTVTIKKTNQILENVKTSSTNKTETIIEAKDGTKQTLKNKDITVVSAPVVWEEPKPEEKPGFFKRLFSSKKEESKPADSVASSQPKVEGEKKDEEPKGFFARRFPELAMGTMALLFVLLP